MPGFHIKQSHHRSNCPVSQKRKIPDSVGLCRSEELCFTDYSHPGQNKSDDRLQKSANQSSFASAEPRRQQHSFRRSGLDQCHQSSLALNKFSLLFREAGFLEMPPSADIRWSELRSPDHWALCMGALELLLLCKYRHACILMYINKRTDFGLSLSLSLSLSLALFECVVVGPSACLWVPRLRRTERWSSCRLREVHAACEWCRR